MKKLCALLSLILLAGVVHGSYQNGYQEDGYTYKDGYWYWSDNTAWTRQWQYYSQPYRSACGCYTYYRQVGYYHYYRAYPPQPVSYRDPEWRVKLLEIAAARDKVEGDARRAAFEQSSFLEGVQALGLQGNFRWNGYGTAPSYPSMTYGQGSYQYGSHGVQGNTVYGYSSYSSVADLYGNTDLNVLYQQASRLAQNSLQLAENARSGHTTLVEKAGDNVSRVAEILAKRDVIRATLEGIKEPRAQVHTKEFHFKVIPDPVSGTPRVEKIDAPEPKNGAASGRLSDADFMAGIVMPSCASCHTGAQAKGGFRASEYLSLSEAAKKVVRDRVLTNDPQFVMPRDMKDVSKPGPLQTEEQKKQWLLH